MAASLTASLSAGLLRVEGTPGVDQIRVRQVNDQIQVEGIAIQSSGGSQAGIPVAAVNRVEISSLGGDDQVWLGDINQLLTPPVGLSDGVAGDVLFSSTSPGGLQLAGDVIKVAQGPEGAKFTLHTGGLLRRHTAAGWQDFERGVADFDLTSTGRAVVLFSTGDLYSYSAATPSQYFQMDGGVRDFAVTPTGRAVVLFETGDLYSFATDVRQYFQLDSGVRDFEVAATGRAVVLFRTGDLYSFATDVRQYFQLDSGVRDFAVTPTGRAIVLFNTGDLYSFGTGANREYFQIDSSVDQFALAPDGSLYTLNLNIGGRLYHFPSGATPGQYQQIDNFVSSFSFDTAGQLDVTYNPIGQKWRELGGPSGFLGTPSGGTFSAGGGLGQHFQGGTIYWSAATGAHAVYGAIRAKYESLGGAAGFLGLPSTDELAAGPTGRVSHFQAGAIFWSTATGANPLRVWLDGTVLRLEGSDVDDGFDLSQEAGQIRLSWHGPVGTYAGSWDSRLINRIEVSGLGGRDLIQVRDTGIPTVLRGGEGNDTLRGGSGGDLLYGEGDDDTLYGSVGEDILNGGAGNDTLKVHLDFSQFLRGGGRSIVDPGVYASGAAGTDTFELSMNLGTFGSQVLQPFLTKAQLVTRPLQPVINFLRREVPYISQWSPGLTFGSLLGSEAMRFGEAIEALNALSPVGFAGDIIPVGTFQVSSLSLPDIRISLAAPELTALATSPFLRALESAGVDLRLVRDPRCLVQLVLDQNVDLMLYRVPDIGLDWNRTFWDQWIPTPVPGLMVHGRLLGHLGFHTGGVLGYDTYGFRTGDVNDGFFARGLHASFNVGLEFMGGGGIPEVVEAGLGGRMDAVLSLTLTDGGDGTVRLAEFGSQLQLDPSLSLRYSVYLYLEHIIRVETRIEGWDPRDWYIEVSFSQRMETRPLAGDVIPLL